MRQRYKKNPNHQNFSALFCTRVHFFPQHDIAQEAACPMLPGVVPPRRKPRAARSRKVTEVARMGVCTRIALSPRSRPYPSAPAIFSSLYYYKMCAVVCVVLCVVVCVVGCVVNTSQTPCLSAFRCVVGCVVVCVANSVVGCVVTPAQPRTLRKRTQSASASAPSTNHENSCRVPSQTCLLGTVPAPSDVFSETFGGGSGDVRRGFQTCAARLLGVVS